MSSRSRFALTEFYSYVLASPTLLAPGLNIYFYAKTTEPYYGLVVFLTELYSYTLLIPIPLLPSVLGCITESVLGS